jgi:hypothetical protein
MRFRVTHLLGATIAFAVFSMGLVYPDSAWGLIAIIVTWLAYSGLAILALTCHGPVRATAIAALIGGLGFAFASQLLPRTPMSFLIEHGFPQNSPQRNDFYFSIHLETIGQFAFSFIAAFLCGVLAAYWSRTSPKK